uniref:Envelopment polyprotein n=1 Tax=Lukuni virus TaxID=1678227 RepID=A0A7D5INF8_9VIRU|nr:polyprotein [Lukuni virus]
MLIVIVLIVCVAHAAPPEKCFQGGDLLKKISSEKSMPHICLRDDVSLIKTVTTAAPSGSGLTAFQNYVYRKFTVEDWRSCRPEKAVGGPLMILSVNDDGFIESEEYVCRNECNIKLDKEIGVLIFETDALNYFEVSGTTITSGWFKTSTSVSLRHTCEHVKIRCGFKSMSVHACFKNHIECYQALAGKYIPNYMATSICTNLELILMTVFSMMIFLLFLICAKTYMCYLLLPIFIPFAYIYGKIQMKKFKTCSNCGLTLHPFTKCKKTCICGSRYESTERLKIHVLSGLCPGYKYIMTARVMCKSKGCGLFLSIFLTILILSFITPIGAAECYTLDQIPSLYRNGIAHEIVHRYYEMASYGYIAIIISLILVINILIFRPQVFLNRSIYSCNDCGMFHLRSGIKLTEFGTNRCGVCLCGCNDESPLYVAHQRSRVCFSDCHIKIYRILVFIMLLLLMPCIVPAVSADNCDTDPSTSSCFGLNIQSAVAGTSNKTNEFAMLTELFPDISIEEYNSIKDKISAFKSMTFEAYHYQSLRPIQIIEALFFSRSKYLDSSYRTSDEYMKWRVRAKVAHLEICPYKSATYPCQCIQNDLHCEVLKRGNRASNTKILLDNTEKLKMDIQVLQGLSVQIFQPSVIYMYYYSVKSKNQDKFTNFSKTVYEMYNEYPYLLNMIYLLLNATEKVGLSQIEFSNLIPFKSAPVMLSTVTVPAAISPKTVKIQKSQCKKVRCITPRIATSPFLYLLCDKKIFFWTDTYTKRTNDICNFDANCDIPFPSLTEDQLAMFNKHKHMCSEFQSFELSTQYSTGSTSCIMKKKGTCMLNGSLRQIVVCDNGKMYEQYATGHYPNDGSIHKVCFKTGCPTSYPRDPESLKNCSIAIPKIHHGSIETTYVNDINSYRQLIEDSFYSTLINFAYEPTSGLPDVLPTFKPLTMTGTSTESGVERAQISFDINAIGGQSTGINLLTPEGDHIMDLIIFVRSANVTSTYQMLYQTGPTIAYNSHHYETCTGPCPELELTDNSWVKFHKESTSTWGCEQYGCLAINTGCLYGECKDVISPEGKVYSKATSEKSMVELCVTTSHDFYCTHLDSSSAIVTGKLNAQFKTVESFVLPDKVFVKNHRVKVGQINNIGEFSKYCGNVQYFNGSVIGTGIPNFDYRCHAATKKDLIIHKCYDNYYDSCLALTDAQDLIIDTESDMNMELSKHEKNLGVISLQVQLGDIHYKIFQKEPEIGLEATCIGCHDCISGIQCDLNIKTSVSATCQVSSNCNPMVTRLSIHPDQVKYFNKFFCKSSQTTIDIKICKTSIKTTIQLTKRRPMLEINTISRSPVVVERDNTCGTWLCRVGEEISSLFSMNVTGIFSKLWHYVLIIFGSIIALLIFNYILLPIFKILILSLKKHDREYKLSGKQY